MRSIGNWRTDKSDKTWYPWGVFISVVGGTFMVNVDSSIMNVALPVLQQEFQVGPSVLQWVISAYLLVITGILPLVGSLSDKLNRKTVFMSGVVIFTGGSLLCAFSASIGELILFRVIQSVGGAIIMGNVMSIVASVFPAGQRGKPLGLIGSVVAAGTIVGPSLGGLLITTYGWHSIFWVNVPIGIASFLMSYVVMMNGTKQIEKLREFDGWGSLFFFAAVISVLLYVSDGQTWGWESWISWSVLAVSLSAWVLFIQRELKVVSPVIDLKLFRSTAFVLGNVVGYISYVLMMFPGFILPLYMQHVLHIPMAHIGLLLTPQAIAMIVFSPVGGWLADKYGTRWPVLLGMVISSFGLWQMAGLSRASSYVDIILALSVFGLGIGLFTSSNNVSVLESVPVEQTGLTGSLIATVRNFGRVSGVALAVLLLQSAGTNLGTSSGFANAASFSFSRSMILGVIAILLSLGKILQYRPFKHD